MLPYSRGLILDNTHNYGIMKTETVFGFSPSIQDNYNNSASATKPLEWIFNNSQIQNRSLQVDETPKALQSKEQPIKKQRKNKKKAKTKKKNRKSKKINKCIIKFLRKGQQQGGGEDQSMESYGGKKTRRRGNKFQKMQKKYMMPAIIGLLAAKSLLIPIALKALAFMSAKGLMLAFFSTVLASVMSLKGMFNHPQEYHNRKDDAKTQVEIIQVPTKSEDHVYYDEHYKRGDYVPVMPNDMIFNKKYNKWKGIDRNRNNSGERKVNDNNNMFSNVVRTDFNPAKNM